MPASVVFSQSLKFFGKTFQIESKSLIQHGTQRGKIHMTLQKKMFLLPKSSEPQNAHCCKSLADDSFWSSS